MFIHHTHTDEEIIRAMFYVESLNVKLMRYRLQRRLDQVDKLRTLVSQLPACSCNDQHDELISEINETLNLYK